jgi:hypothetical protein
VSPSGRFRIVPLGDVVQLHHPPVLVRNLGLDDPGRDGFCNLSNSRLNGNILQQSPRTDMGGALAGDLISSVYIDLRPCGGCNIFRHADGESFVLLIGECGHLSVYEPTCSVVSFQTNSFSGR